LHRNYLPLWSIGVHSSFSEVRVVQYLVFCVVFCQPFVCLSVLFRLANIQLLITS
jgi:hypothetical protein